MDVSEVYAAQFREAMMEFMGFVEADDAASYSMTHWFEGHRFLLDMSNLPTVEGKVSWSMQVYRWREGEMPVHINTVIILKE